MLNKDRMMDAVNILIIEDDAVLREELCRRLALQGFKVQTCDDYPQASLFALNHSCDCILLDLTLPDADGHEICRAIREESDVSIIVITSSDQEFDEVMALGLGADDYLQKPFSPAVLVAHVQAVLRRKAATERKSVGGVTLDEARATVSYGKTSTELTRNELHLLRELLARPNAVVSRQELMYALWENDEFIDDNTLTVNMNRLRRTLASIGVPDDFIATRRGLGYQING